MKYFNIYAALIMLIFKYSLGHHHRERIYFPDEIVGVPEASSTDYFNDQDKGKAVTPPEFDIDYDLLIQHLNNSDSAQKKSSLDDQDKGKAVTPPEFDIDYVCGNPYYKGLSYGFLHNETELPVYFLNQTAEDLASKGFKISVNKVENGDVLSNFSYSNSTFEGILAYKKILKSSFVIGGENSPIPRSYYMAQLGEKHGDIITWLCDGVLVNLRWILSAAHCFVKPGVNPNIVRLGDYNLSDPVDAFSGLKKFIRDYSIHKLVFHPEFMFEERYHDLVLIQIPREIPLVGHNFVPICLPWDSDGKNDLVGSEVALTGWGATEYGGSKTSILQQVFLKIFDTSVCAKSYSELRDTKLKYPSGITSDKILCVGWDEDGKDACGGDSGAPIVYQKAGEYILTGIVSGGFGCGLREFPGLYIPINKPKYLQWIKDVAFRQD